MKILLSVYSVRIVQAKESQLLSKFGGNVDFLRLFYSFLKDLNKLTKHWERPKHPKLSLTCESIKKMNYSKDERFIYGHFEAGRDGDSFKVKNFNKDPKKIKRIRKEESSMRTAFFYLNVPKNSKEGHLILQVPEGQGIKHLLQFILSDFIKNQGLQLYHLELNSLINEKIFYKMLDNGLLKEMTFIKRGIPEFTEDLKNNDSKPRTASGSVKTVFQSHELGAIFKQFAKDIFKIKRSEKNGDSRSLIEFQNIQSDELSMKIEYDGKQKTFYANNYSRTLPDIEVTNEVLNSENEIDLDKMVIQARELIKEAEFKITENDLTY